MEKNIKFTSIFKRTHIDVYIFIICNHFKKSIEHIASLLDIEKIPKKLFDDYKLNHSFEKRLYLDTTEILFIGVDKEKKCDNKNLFNIFGKLGKEMYLEKKNIFIHLVGSDELLIKNQVNSYILGYYLFNDFKTNSIEKGKEKGKIHSTFFYHPMKKMKKIVDESIYESLVQNEIRGLINTPANILTSKKYSNYMKTHILDDVQLKNVTIKILDETKLKKIGCNLILGVNQGSKNKAMMVVMEYKNLLHIRGKVKPIVFVGKGVIFDSGGYNIKTGDFSDMKNDMTGSAIVYGLFKLFSKMNVSGHYIGLLPLVENMVDANSIRPGDILKAYNGKTVEIIDTDAEGRLIMADALAYAKNYNPYLCIDIATLTGQAVSIFDSKSSVIMGNNNKYIQKMIQAGIHNNEKIWELPMWEEYIELTRSNIADLKNFTVEAKASTIMGGAFLANFIPKGSNWIHLDIAGVDNLKHNTESRHYGATGEILRTLFYFTKHFEKEIYDK
jgi:leucyl aminopeptidase